MVEIFNGDGNKIPDKKKQEQISTLKKGVNKGKRLVNKSQRLIRKLKKEESETLPQEFLDEINYEISKLSDEVEE